MIHRTTDSFDQPNAPNGPRLPDYNTERPATRPAPPAWIVGVVAIPILAATLIAAIPLIRLARLASDALLDHAALISNLVQVVLIVATVGILGTLAAVARWVWRKATVAGLVRLPGDVPIIIEHLDQPSGAQLAARALASHYETQGRWADASKWRGTSTYAPNVSYRYDTRQGDMHPALIDGPARPAPFGDGPILQRLIDQRLIDAGTLVVGFTPEGEPAQIRLDATGFIALAGQTRSGKTTTALSLISQLAYTGGLLFVADPHARSGEHGLIPKSHAVSGCYLKQAVSDEEINRVIALVAKIARRRLDGHDPADQPVILICDEFTALAARGAIDDSTLAALIALAVESAKVKVHAILIAQDWSARLTGGTLGASLRRAVTHRIIHRCDPGTADLLLPGTSFGREVASLDRGQALYWPADAPPGVIAVPRVGDADLTLAARGTPPKPYAPWNVPALPSGGTAPPALPTAPPVGLTVAGKISQLLADGQPRSSAEIATAINEDRGAVQTACTRLTQDGVITRSGSARNYTYHR